MGSEKVRVEMVTPKSRVPFYTYCNPCVFFCGENVIAGIESYQINCLFYIIQLYHIILL